MTATFQEKVPVPERARAPEQRFGPPRDLGACGDLELGLDGRHRREV